MARPIIIEGKASFQDPETGDYYLIPMDEAAAAAKAGMVPETREAYFARSDKEYYDKPGSAAAAGFLRGGTLGLSDVAMEALQPGRAAALREGSPVASTIGEIGGTVVSAAVPGAPLARVGGLATKAVGGATGVARKMAIGSAEGAAIGAGGGISGVAMARGPVSTEKAAEHIAKEALVGGALGGALSLVGQGLGALGRKVVERGRGPGAKRLQAFIEGRRRAKSDLQDFNAAKASAPELALADDAYQAAKSNRAGVLSTQGSDAQKAIAAAQKGEADLAALRAKGAQKLAQFDNQAARLVDAYGRPTAFAAEVPAKRVIFAAELAEKEAALKASQAGLAQEFQGARAAIEGAEAQLAQATENLTREATRAGFGAGTASRTGRYVGDLRDSIDALTKGIGTAQSEVFSFGLPRMPFGLAGPAGLGAGLISGSLLTGGIGALVGAVGLPLAGRALVKAISNERTVRTLTSALAGTGAGVNYASLTMLTRDQVKGLAKDVSELDPAQTRASAEETYRGAGLGERDAAALADFQGRRLEVLQDTLERTENPLVVTRVVQAAGDPRLVLKAIGKNELPPEYAAVLARVSPAVYRQLSTAAREALTNPELSPKVRRTLQILAGDPRRRQLTEAVQQLHQAARAEQEQQGRMIRGRQYRAPSGATALDAPELGGGAGLR